ncbi:hypothetical protein [Patulibacter sp.]|uniref:hypothetical protein n=1 Tax=Patulibacter sp. TaxID=1912859 RepID=UPI0027156115|nr:hypothetical protein [Patulibacter sp.]MDO9407635.1 hypothetical protein [Patulibacter sp.]
MRHTLALAGALVVTAVPAAVALAPAAAQAQSGGGKSCSRISAGGERVAITVTYGSFGCRDARSLFRAYFRKVDPSSNRGRTIRLSRGGKTFRCMSARTGQFDFLCFGTKNSKPIVAADRLGS